MIVFLRRKLQGTRNVAQKSDDRTSRVVLGYYNHNNVGDEAFKLVFEQLFADEKVEFVSDLDGHPDKEIIFGGGAVVSRYFTCHLPAARKFHMVGCSLPFGRGDLELLRTVQDRLGRMYLRSRSDVEIANEAGFDAEFIPDIVFSLEPQEIDDPLQKVTELATLVSPEFGSKDRNLVVVLSDDYTVLYSEERLELFKQTEFFKNALADALDQLAAKFNLIFLPFSIWHNARDNVFAADVVRRMKKKHLACVVDRILSPRLALDLIYSLQGPVLSMKYHGLVFAMLGGAFPVNIGQTKKNRDLMTDAGVAGLSLRRKSITAKSIISALEKHSDPLLTATLSRSVTAMRGAAASQLRNFKAQLAV